MPIIPDTKDAEGKGSLGSSKPDRNAKQNSVPKIKRKTGACQ